jgi:hypothetical protein
MRKDIYDQLKLHVNPTRSVQGNGSTSDNLNQRSMEGIEDGANNDYSNTKADCNAYRLG